MMVKKNYDILDLTKFVASLAIVAIHSDALLELGTAINYYICQGLFRIAVPLFFLITAFFFFQKELTKQHLQKYCYRLLKLYGIWFVLTLPITVFNRFIGGGDYSFGVKIFRFVRSIFLSSTFGGSWFLVACIFNALLFWQLNKIQSPRLRQGTILFISIVAYVWCVLSSSYGKWIDTMPGMTKFYCIYEMLFCKPYTSVLVGIPYFAVGKVFATKGNISLRRSIYGGIFLLFACELYFVRHFDLQRSSDCYFMLLPLAVVIMAWLLRSESNIFMAKELRIISTLVFFSHFAWLFVFEFAEWLFNITLFQWAKFLLTVLASMAGALVIVYYSRRCNGTVGMLLKSLY